MNANTRLIEQQIDTRNRLVTARSGWLPLWHESAVFCCPDKRQGLVNAGALNSSYRPLTVENSIAIDSLGVFAGGLKQWIIPGANTGWWQWQPQVNSLTHSNKREWLIECTERAETYIENGGVYDSGHEAFQDMGWAGHGGILVLPGIEKLFVSTSLAPQEFVFQKDFDGNVSRCIVTWHKRASELVQMFGRENVSVKISQAVDLGKGEDTFEVILSILKREDRRLAAYPGDPAAMMWQGLWIEVAEKSLMKDEGYEEMPLIVPRWQKWSNSNEFAVSPAMNALADIKNVNTVEWIEGVLAQTQLEPRLKRKAGTMGAIDLRPGGLTEVSDMTDVQTWAHEGQSREADKRIDRKSAQIRRMFYTDTFEPLQGINREMNIPEIEERQAAGMNRVGPPGSRLGREFVNPLMRRVFMMLYRGNVFSQPPPEMFTIDDAGQRFFEYPKTVQANRMSRALSNKKVRIFNGMMSRVLPIAQAGKPEVLDSYNFDNITKDLDEAEGMPEGWRYTDEEKEARAAARAQAMQQQQAQAAILQAVGSKPGEVAGIAQNLAGQMGGAES